MIRMSIKSKGFASFNFRIGFFILLMISLIALARILEFCCAEHTTFAMCVRIILGCGLLVMSCLAALEQRSILVVFSLLISFGAMLYFLYILNRPLWIGYAHCICRSYHSRCLPIHTI
jgi:hypothetical protein